MDPPLGTGAQDQLTRTGVPRNHSGVDPNKRGIQMLKSFWNDESGATAIEYGLIAALIAVAIIGGARTLGTNIGATFNNVGNAVK